MKKTFIEKLPHKYGFGVNKDKVIVNWKASIGYEVNFIYDNIQGKIKIIDYDSNKQKLKIQYKGNNYFINTNQLKKCQLGDILGIKTKRYKYQVGDIITNVHSGKLKILEQIRMGSGKHTEKGYHYKCLICGNEDTIMESSLNNRKCGCNVCCTPSQKILIGYNDMWTTNPELAKLLADPNDGYKYMQGVTKYTNWVCPDCGNIIEHKRISTINKYGLSCSKCSDKIPYPEKFTYQFLQQLLKNDFTYQLTNTTFEWINDYRYDFYFKINNEKYILETHGGQHYQGGFERMKSNRHTKNLQEEQENDRLKKELAIRNGIKEENYIVINCKNSTLKWIKNSILSSKLNDIFDLSKIDWLKCHEYACKSFVKQVSDLWANGIHSTKEIGNIMKLSITTIIRYLKQGTELKWCDYNAKENANKIIKENLLKIKKINSKKIICLNNNKIFNSIKEAQQYYNIKHINNNKVSCGIDPETKQYLQWQYYDEYLIKPKKLLSNNEINNIHNERKIKRRIICLNDKKIFNFIKEILIFYNLKSAGGINICCKNKIRHSGINLRTGEYLQWQYYDEYLIKPKKLLSNEEIDKINNYKQKIKKSNAKKVICLNNNKIFNSVTEAKKYYHTSDINACCKYKKEYSGKDPITKEKLHWMYYDEYLNKK